MESRKQKSRRHFSFGGESEEPDRPAKKVIIDFKQTILSVGIGVPL